MIHIRENRWPTDNTVIVAGSVKSKLALEAAFAMPEPGPKRRLPMSAKLFDAIMHDAGQGHLATGIRPEDLALPASLHIELDRALGNVGCEDVAGIILPQDVWENVELQADKLWRIPLAIVDSQSSFRPVML